MNKFNYGKHLKISMLYTTIITLALYYNYIIQYYVLMFFLPNIINKLNKAKLINAYLVALLISRCRFLKEQAVLYRSYSTTPFWEEPMIMPYAILSFSFHCKFHLQTFLREMIEPNK